MLIPQFKTALDYEKAEVLMQPAYLRVIDNLRRSLETCDWENSYEEISEPFPGHRLCLKKAAQTRTIEIWALCFQVCFVDFPTESPGDRYDVTIDDHLFTPQGELNWDYLEEKTQVIVEKIFAQLPS